LARVLVTGGDGFVGEHLIAHLLAEGREVTASTLALPPRRDTLTSDQASAVDWKLADVLDPAALFRVVAAVRPDEICHLAGFSSGARAREEPEAAMRINAGGTVNLFEAVLNARADFPDLNPRVLVMGSGASYGHSAVDDVGLAEDLPLLPLSAYGLSKACQELVAHSYGRSSGLRVVVARAFHLIGPGQRTDFVVPSLCEQVAGIADGRLEPVLQVGNTEVERDFLDVRDGVRAFRIMLELDEPSNAYNVCSGRATPIRQMLDWILDEAGVEPEVMRDPSRVRHGEPDRITGDPGRLLRSSSFEPQRDIQATVRETYRWYTGMAP